jgi:hypothetical protein
LKSKIIIIILIGIFIFQLYYFSHETLRLESIYENLNMEDKNLNSALELQNSTLFVHRKANFEILEIVNNQTSVTVVDELFTITLSDTLAPNYYLAKNTLNQNIGIYYMDVNSILPIYTYRLDFETSKKFIETINNGYSITLSQTEIETQIKEKIEYFDSLEIKIIID